MWQRLRYQLPVRITSLPASKLMALFVVLVVPGGLMLPLCYAAYAAVVHTASRKPPARDVGITAGRLHDK